MATWEDADKRVVFIHAELPFFAHISDNTPLLPLVQHGSKVQATTVVRAQPWLARGSSRSPATREINYPDW